MMRLTSTINGWFEGKPQLICFVLGLLCTLPLIFLTPPFQVPDEPQHFYRAYQISELRFISSLNNGKGGDMLPSSLIDLSSHYLGSREIHTRRLVVKKPLSSLAEGFRMPLETNKREFIDFTGAAFYSPLPYLPQAVAIAAGRSLGCGPLVLMYLARFINAIVAVFLLSLAIRFAPTAKLAFLVLGLLPMSVYLFASLSPDALVIGSTFTFTAVAFRSYVKDEWRVTDILTAIVCATIFCSIKIVYAPLLFLAAPSVLASKRPAKSLLIQVALVLIPIAITAIWLHAVSGLVVPAKAGTSMPAQIQYVIAHPLYFVQAIIHGFLWNDLYFFTTIGTLGWLTVKLPLISYALPVIAFAIALYAYPAHVPVNRVRTLLWWSALGGACVVLVMLTLYCYWTPVAAAAVEGVQGRYFIPIIPLFAMAIAGFWSKLKLNYSLMQATIWIFSIIVIEANFTFFALARAYWIT